MLLKASSRLPGLVRTRRSPPSVPASLTSAESAQPPDPTATRRCMPFSPIASTATATGIGAVNRSPPGISSICTPSPRQSSSSHRKALGRTSASTTAVADFGESTLIGVA